MNKKLYLNAIYQTVIDEAGSHSPFETVDLVKQERDFIKKYLLHSLINSPFYKPVKALALLVGVGFYYVPNGQDQSDFELDLLENKWNNIRNAFEIGFNVALDLILQRNL